MVTKPQEKYKNTFEFWHKDTVSTIMFQIETVSKECESCESYDLDIINFHSTDPIHGTIMISYFCRDCDHIERVEYPVISRRSIEKYDKNSNKIDDLLKNNLQFEKL